MRPATCGISKNDAGYIWYAPGVETQVISTATRHLSSHILSYTQVFSKSKDTPGNQSEVHSYDYYYDSYCAY